MNSINPNIEVGVGARPYHFGWFLGFTASSIVYVVLSMFVAPDRKTFIDKAVLPDDIYDQDGVVDEGVSLEGSGSGEEGVTEEKAGWKARLTKIL